MSIGTFDRTRVTFIALLALLLIHNPAGVDLTVLRKGYISEWARPMAVVEMHGIRTSFLIDTGSSRSAIDSSLARMFSEDEPSHDPKTLPVNVKIGSQMITDKQFSVVDFANARIVAMEPFYGIIGMDVLNGLTLELNYDAKLAQIALPPILRSAHHKIPLKRDSLNCPLVEISVGATNISALLDSGADFSVTLSKREFSKLCAELDIKPRVRAAFLYDANGTTQSEKCVNARISFNPQ